MIKWNKRFEYPTSTRALINGKRHYDVGTEEKLPSVTTILSATQSEEKKESLAKWKQKVGENKADEIRDSAAERGTIMHRIIEGHLLGQRHADLSDLGQNAGTMAQKIINEGLEGRMDEIWGSEITIYYPGLFAGATDLAGIYEGRESIIDFKQSNKLKRKEWIEDYFIQLAAYALGHNYVYNTSIQSGTILMCTKDNIFQRFDITGEEFKKYTYKWLERVDQYYCNIGNVTGESEKSE
jgi:genome maintenance exonuclease 1